MADRQVLKDGTPLGMCSTLTLAYAVEAELGSLGFCGYVES